MYAKWVKYFARAYFNDQEMQPIRRDKGAWTTRMKLPMQPRSKRGKTKQTKKRKISCLAGDNLEEEMSSLSGVFVVDYVDHAT